MTVQVRTVALAIDYDTMMEPIGVLGVAHGEATLSIVVDGLCNQDVFRSLWDHSIWTQHHCVIIWSSSTERCDLGCPVRRSFMYTSDIQLRIAIRLGTVHRFVCCICSMQTVSLFQHTQESSCLFLPTCCISGCYAAKNTKHLLNACTISSPGKNVLRPVGHVGWL